MWLLIFFICMCLFLDRKNRTRIFLYMGGLLAIFLVIAIVLPAQALGVIVVAVVIIFAGIFVYENNKNK